MYMAKIGNVPVEVGTIVEMAQIENFKFEVLEIRERDFRIRWAAGKTKGQMDSIPYSLFAGIGNPVEVVEVSDNPTDPNRAFLYRRLSNGC